MWQRLPRIFVRTQRDRQVKPKGCAVTFLTLQSDATRHHGGKLSTDRQAQTRPGGLTGNGPIDLPKLLKDLFLIFGGNATAIVFDRDTDRAFLYHTGM